MFHNLANDGTSHRISEAFVSLRVAHADPVSVPVHSTFGPRIREFLQPFALDWSQPANRNALANKALTARNTMNARLERASNPVWLVDGVTRIHDHRFAATSFRGS